MNSNQSLHLTIKQPPNPNPVRTLAVFGDIHDPGLPRIIQAFLSEVDAVPKDAEFLQNVREEVIKTVLGGTVLTVARSGTELHVIIREKQAP